MRGLRQQQQHESDDNSTKEIQQQPLGAAAWMALLRSGMCSS